MSYFIMYLQCLAFVALSMTVLGIAVGQKSIYRNSRNFNLGFARFAYFTAGIFTVLLLLLVQFGQVSRTSLLVLGILIGFLVRLGQKKNTLGKSLPVKKME